MIYDTPLAGARVRQPIRVTHSGEEGLMQWSQLRSVFFICFNEGTHRKTGVSDAWCAAAAYCSRAQRAWRHTMMQGEGGPMMQGVVPPLPPPPGTPAPSHGRPSALGSLYPRWLPEARAHA